MASLSNPRGRTPYDFCICDKCGPPWRMLQPSLPGMWMSLCPECGSKRCAGALDHDNECEHL